VKIADGLGNTPLHVAALYGRKDCLETLLRTSSLTAQYHVSILTFLLIRRRARSLG
jgi:ankyrin repeat protein